MTTTFEPANADWQAAVRAGFAAQQLMRTFGAELGVLSPGRCEIRLPFRAGLTQQDGFLHAGVVAAIADNAGGFAALTLMASGARVLTAEFKVNLLAPARGDLLIARGRVVKPGRTLTVCAVEAVMREGGEERDCAVMQQTCIAMMA